MKQSDFNIQQLVVYTSRPCLNYGGYTKGTEKMQDAGIIINALTCTVIDVILKRLLYVQLDYRMFLCCCCFLYLTETQRDLGRVVIKFFFDADD